MVRVNCQNGDGGGSWIGEFLQIRQNQTKSARPLLADPFWEFPNCISATAIAVAMAILRPSGDDVRVLA